MMMRAGASIQRADHILVVDAGRIVERGRHTQLLQQSGLYQRLHNAQFTEEVVDELEQTA
jgi:ABC-type multidrug transport system fused ATPase/permease subunit